VVIYKYVLNVERTQHVSTPEGARVLSVGCQGDNICVWALVDPKRPMTQWRYDIYGTGHVFEREDLEGMGFLDTVSMHGGSLIWHVFTNQPR